MSKKKRTTPAAAAPRPAAAASPLTLQTLAQQRFSEKRYDETAQLCRQLIAVRPAHAGAWQMLGMAALMQGAPAEALPALERAHQLDARNTQTLCLLGVARQRLGQVQEAVASFDAALALAPTQAGIHYDRATVLMQLDRHEEALAGFERALSLAPGMRDGWVNRGIALGKLRRHTEAIASFERALDIAQRQSGGAKPARGTPQARQLAKIWQRLAAALRAAGRDPDALGAWEQVLALDDSDANSWLGMADALSALGSNSLALERLRRACELAPDSPEPHRRLGDALAKDKTRISEAIAELLRAHELAPESVSIAFTLMHQGMRIALGRAARPPAADAGCGAQWQPGHGCIRLSGAPAGHGCRCARSLAHQRPAACHRQRARHAYAARQARAAAHRLPLGRPARTPHRLFDDGHVRGARQKPL